MVVGGVQAGRRVAPQRVQRAGAGPAAGGVLDRRRSGRGRRRGRPARLRSGARRPGPSGSGTTRQATPSTTPARTSAGSRRGAASVAERDDASARGSGQPASSAARSSTARSGCGSPTKHRQQPRAPALDLARRGGLGGDEALDGHRGDLVQVGEQRVGEHADRRGLGAWPRSRPPRSASTRRARRGGSRPAARRASARSGTSARRPRRTARGRRRPSAGAARSRPRSRAARRRPPGRRRGRTAPRASGRPGSPGRARRPARRRSPGSPRRPARRGRPAARARAAAGPAGRSPWRTLSANAWKCNTVVRAVLDNDVGRAGTVAATRR